MAIRYTMAWRTKDSPGWKISRHLKQTVREAEDYTRDSATPKLRESYVFAVAEITIMEEM